MVSIAVPPTWELLQATNVTDAQLAALQKSWQQLDFISDATNVFMLERVFGIEIIEKARASHAEFQKIVGWSSSGGSSGSAWSWPPDWEEITEKPRYATAEAMWRSSWSYAAELNLMQSLQIVLETLRIMHTNQSQFYKADYEAMTKRLPSPGAVSASRGFFRSLKIPDLSELFGDWGQSSVVQKTLRIETADRMVAVAIVLKRFQLKHGQWPKALDELVPEFISSVPIDPYDGKSLKYHSNADGTYLLYSVAENGVDDGGSPTLATEYRSMNWQYYKSHDWVWPQPATAEEIKAYYAAEAAKAAADAGAESPGTALIETPPSAPAGTN